MKRTLMRAAGLGVLMAVAWPNEAHASFPTGVWTRVDKVVYDNPADPSTIEIHGAIMLYNKDQSTQYPGYSNPALGYVFYSCPAGQKKTCQAEWADIEKNIGAPSDQCIGFGDQVSMTGTLRMECDAPANPDPYPIAMGALMGFSPCTVIQTFLSNVADAGPCSSSSSSSSSSSGSTTSSSSSSSGSTTSSTSGGSTSSTSTSGGATSSATTGAGTTGGNNDVGGKGGCSAGGSGGPFGVFGLSVLALGIGLARRKKVTAPRGR